jgi:hypothetical protein
MLHTDSGSDPLFAPTAQESRLSDPTPVVVVGLPRSGSSLLSHVLSQATDWYVFDDLYTARQAQGLGADFDSPLTSSQFEEMLHFLGWQIRARLLHTEYAKPACTIDEVELMNDAIRACFKDSLPSWRACKRNGWRDLHYEQAPHAGDGKRLERFGTLMN